MRGLLLLLVVMPVAAQPASNLRDLRAIRDHVAAEAAKSRQGAKLHHALDLLAGTPTGRPLVDLLHNGSARLEIEKANEVMYGNNVVYFSREWIRELEVWQIAVFLAHELEHARQDDLGVLKAGGMGVGESGAFWMQSRVWVELGRKIRAQDLPQNRVNSQDMLAWLSYPWSAIAAITVRSEKPLLTWHPVVKSYWDDIVRSEAAWRAQWAHTWDNRASLDAARYVLQQATRYRKKGDPHPGLPDYIELLASPLSLGRKVEAPARVSGPPLSAADRLLLESIGLHP